MTSNVNSIWSPAKTPSLVEPQRNYASSPILSLCGSVASFSYNNSSFFTQPSSSYIRGSQEYASYINIGMSASTNHSVNEQSELVEFHPDYHNQSTNATWGYAAM